MINDSVWDRFILHPARHRTCFIFYVDCHLDLSIFYLIANCDGCRARGRQLLLNLEHLEVL